MGELLTTHANVEFNLASKAEASSWFRSILVDRPVTAGTWKLKIENTDDRELSAIVANRR